MTREQKLLTLLQSKEYVSKIKLFCPYSHFSCRKFGEIDKDSYIRRVKIEDIKNEQNQK